MNGPRQGEGGRGDEVCGEERRATPLRTSGALYGLPYVLAGVHPDPCPDPGARSAAHHPPARLAPNPADALPPSRRALSPPPARRTGARTGLSCNLPPQPPAAHNRPAAHPDHVGLGRDACARMLRCPGAAQSAIWAATLSLLLG